MTEVAEAQVGGGRRLAGIALGVVRLGLVIGLAVGVGSVCSPVARADETVVACDGPNNIFTPNGEPGITVGDNCSSGGGLDLTATIPESQGAASSWQATAPAGLTIVGAGASLHSAYVNDGNQGQYGGGFTWGGGGGQEITPGENSALVSFPGGSSSFGFFMVCGLSTCNETDSYVDVYSVLLDVRETEGPVLDPGGSDPSHLVAPSEDLWDAGGWVRGEWSVGGSGYSPSGICTLTASLDGQPLASASATYDDHTQWHQCAGAGLDDPVNTAAYPNGTDQLLLEGTDAAGDSTGPYAKLVGIDNQQPSVSFSGPTDAPSTAGTQYVTATANTGPSGVFGMACRVDGGSPQWAQVDSMRLAVSGVGTHMVTCFSESNATDPSGTHGMSPLESYSVRIGYPTVAAVAFSRVVDKLRCHREWVRVKVPAQTMRVRFAGKVVVLHRKAHYERRRVTRCHTRTARRRVTSIVTINRHGKKIRVRRTRTVVTVLKPRTILKTAERIGHGKPATVYGWLGASTPTGVVALAGQTVDVLSAPDDGSNDYRIAAVATTDANGAWTARLPPGPSRLVTATFAGTPNTESALAPPVHLSVPAKVKLLKLYPRHVAWGGTIHLVGRLDGGYLPPGGALVRLRIGEGPSFTTYGVHAHVGGSGRFHTTYTFGVGQAAIHRSFWFQIASLPMGDYPYAEGSSRRLSVLVGGNPPRHRR